MATVRKAVIPAAGLGTRFLPASKAVPKELLPLGDRPVLQVVVEEAVAAGLTHVAVVTSADKAAVRAHFEPMPQLEASLEAKGDAAGLARVRAVGAGAELEWLTQDAPRGLGHAVACAKDFVAGEPFAVLLGDDLLDEEHRALSDMVAVREALGGSVLLLVEVPEEATRRFGIAAVEPLPAGTNLDLGSAGATHVVRVTGLQEKPEPDVAASRLAVIGRYVLDPQIFDELAGTAPGAGGEIQLTDAIHALAGMPSELGGGEIQLTDAIHALAGMPPERGGGVHAVIFTGIRYDTGQPAEYLKAVVQVAARHPETGAAFRDWLKEFMADTDPASGGSTP